MQKTTHSLFALALSFFAVPFVTGQTHTKGAPMTLDTTDLSCSRLHDANQWTTFAGYMSGVGTQATLSDVLANLNNTAVHLDGSSGNVHPPATGYGNGIKWDSTDQGTSDWTPQGLALGVLGSIDYSIVSWHYNNPSSSGNIYAPNGSRISILDTTSLSSTTYRNVILVKPTGTGTYSPVLLHVGGLAIAGNYLYVADTDDGMWVFDLNNFRKIDGDLATCRQSDGTGIFGKVGSEWCADGYGYMLPELNHYTSSGITGSCNMKFGYLGKDTRPSSGPQILSGEYCNTSSDTCNGDSTGLNGRLYQWPLGSDNKLVTTSGYAYATKIYYMNERQIQGVAPDMVSGAATDSYWLSTSEGSGGGLFKVSPSANAKSWTYNNSQMPYNPEGIHATSSSGHLWMVTEGNGGTNPATGGRVLIYVDQSAIN